MQLSISNIAWDSPYDEEMYQFISNNGFTGLEIAPTQLFGDAPYDKLTEAKTFVNSLKRYNLAVCSIQSIWYGLEDRLFSTAAERQNLLKYTKKAVDFAANINCVNIVFGCPKNRKIPNNFFEIADNNENAENPQKTDFLAIAQDFFSKIGNYAHKIGCCIAIEPNPPIYNTNFINTTPSAFEFCENLGNAGVKVNIDLGTMLYYAENADILRGNSYLINHVHFSETLLAVPKKREFHREIFAVLSGVKYINFVSIEMSKTDLETVKNSVLYLKEVYHEFF
ncbi:MAG: sugar phosphate isomerase/epimerase [Firmicutes bacterium]|nr:sugar phosphate isomerase/epimerase [Bacillota bacterium]